MTFRRLPSILEIALATVLVLPCACAGSGPAGGSHAANHPGTPPHDSAPLELNRLVVTPTSADSIGVICERGMQQFRAEGFVAAARDLDLCVRADPSGPYVASALYYGAIALDRTGRFDASLERFGAAIGHLDADAPLARDAALRGVRLACHLERWALARQFAEWLLTRKPPLQPLEKVLVYGALALEAVSRGDDVRAERHVAEARNEIEGRGFDSPGKISRDIAGVYFALGEVRRLRAERTKLEYSPEFADVLERRCEWILAAQAAYSDAMRAFDAHWSTMAGYRVSELYAALHRDLMRIPAPPSAKTQEQRQLFEGAMRLRYSVLVQKALGMLQHTLTMAERTSEQSEWVERARAARAELEQRLAQEQLALDALPFSRENLEAALERLTKQNQRKP